MPEKGYICPVGIGSDSDSYLRYLICENELTILFYLYVTILDQYVEILYIKIDVFCNLHLIECNRKLSNVNNKIWICF